MATGFPALAAAFMDSDCGLLNAATPAGNHWFAILDRVAAADYGMSSDHDDVESVLASALAWSVEAGLQPSPELVRRALTESAVFAEELLDLLFAGLGIPGAAVPARSR